MTTGPNPVLVAQTLDISFPAFVFPPAPHFRLCQAGELPTVLRQQYHTNVDCRTCAPAETESGFPDLITRLLGQILSCCWGLRGSFDPQEERRLSHLDTTSLGCNLTTSKLFLLQTRVRSALVDDYTVHLPFYTALLRFSIYLIGFNTQVCALSRNLYDLCIIRHRIA